MIICASCGTANPATERFCGECGDFLEWSTARTDPPAGAAGTVDPLPAADPPAAVQPTVVATPHRRPPRRAPSGARQTGDDWHCDRCGAGNDRQRRFCGACGEPRPVAVAETAKRPWWRRWLDRIAAPRVRRSDRRRREHARRRLLLVIALICLLTIALVGGPLLGRRLVDEVRDRVQDHVPLNPDTVTASSQERDHPAAHIADGVTNRFWSPATAADGSWVEARWADPVRVLDVVVTSGVSTEQELFLTVGRPAALAVTATTTDGRTVEGTLELRDQPGPQRFTFEAADVVRLRLEVRSAYGPRSRPSLAIGEVEFFGRR